MPQKKEPTNRDISMPLEEFLPEASKNRGINYLLAIGIDEYVDVPPLYNAVKDAKDVVEVLLNRFQFEKEHILTLYNEEATKQKIYDAARSFLKKVTPEDNFLVYFSGHGTFDKDFGLGYWIPVDAKKDSVADYIPNSEIRTIFSAIKSRHTFLIIDSCFSGALFAAGASRNVARRERDPSRWGLTAGRNEIVSDGQPGENSPFASSLLYQLKNADRPIGVAELCDKVLEVVSSSANQTPRGEPLKLDGHKGGQFFFHLKMDEKGDWKKAIATNTVAAYQLFLTQYPESSNGELAKNHIKAIQAEKLWEQIELAKADDLTEITAKLNLANQYVDNYEDQPHYEEALNIGELMEYKKDFLEAAPSEFALRRFLGKRVPNVEGANAIKKMAQEKLTDFNKKTTETEIPTIAIPPKRVKKEKPVVFTPPKMKADENPRATIPSKKEEKPIISKIPKSKPKPASPITPEPSFFKKNKKYILVAFSVIPLLIYGIYSVIKSNDKRLDDIVIKKGTFIDARDGRTYQWVTFNGGKKWMAENLNFETNTKPTSSWCYDNNDNKCIEFGRLYNFDAAKSVCPDGWHLPTEKEWESLITTYGGGKSAYNYLVKGGKSSFDALLGGERSRYGSGMIGVSSRVGFLRNGLNGYYWSRTRNPSRKDLVWYYHFESKEREVIRHSGNKENALSCRCIEN